LPPRSEPSHRLPRDVIFVIDTSGSMKGTSIRQARAALERAMRVTLGPRDRFNVIEFDSSYSMLFAESVSVSDRSLRQASAFVASLDANGGTEMAAPLRAALASRSPEGVLKHIVFMTDGAVGNEQALFELIDARLGDARLFTVGIGSAPNSYFMRKAAEFGRGTFTYIGDTGEVGERIDRLLQKLERPVARNLRVEWQGSAPPEVFPKRLPALYDGEPLLVSARSEYLTGDALVSAELSGRAWQQRVPIVQARQESGIGTLWAREKIASLEDELVRGRPAEQVRNAIVDVALAHQLMSRFTSLVAVESYASRRPGDGLSRSNVPNRIAQGQTMVSMPATATHADLAFLLGVLAIVLALVVHLAARRLT